MLFCGIRKKQQSSQKNIIIYAKKVSELYVVEAEKSLLAETISLYSG